MTLTGLLSFLAFLKKSNEELPTNKHFKYCKVFTSEAYLFDKSFFDWKSGKILLK